MTSPDRGIGLAGHVGLLNDAIRTLGNVFILSSLPSQRIIQQFREAGALNPATATRFHASSIGEEFVFRRLLQVGILREPVPGRYFLVQTSA